MGAVPSGPTGGLSRRKIGTGAIPLLRLPLPNQRSRSVSCRRGGTPDRPQAFPLQGGRWHGEAVTDEGGFLKRGPHLGGSPKGLPYPNSGTPPGAKNWCRIAPHQFCSFLCFAVIVQPPSFAMAALAAICSAVPEKLRFSGFPYFSILRRAEPAFRQENFRLSAGNFAWTRRSARLASARKRPNWTAFSRPASRWRPWPPSVRPLFCCGPCRSPPGCRSGPPPRKSACRGRAPPRR